MIRNNQMKLCITVLLFIAVFLGASKSVHAQASMLDNTFGTNGTVRSYFPTGDSLSDQVSSIAIQSDGKIVVAGTSLDGTSAAFALARCDTNGNLDATFGSGGFVRSVDDGWLGHSMVIQPDGKIVVAGDAQFANADGFSQVAFGLKRFNSNGTPDVTFGSDGESYFFIISLPPIEGLSTNNANSIALQSNGKLVVAGSYVDTINGGRVAFTVARFNSNGSVDNSFGSNGSVRSFIVGGDSTLDVANSVAIQSNGKIVLAGTSYNPSPSAGGLISIALARYDTNGTADTTFGANGTVRVAIPGGQDFDDEAYSIGMQTDGKILVGGFSDLNPSIGTSAGIEFAVARFDSNGTLDNTFGSGGAATTYIAGGDSSSDMAYGLALQPNGKIVLAGSTYFTEGNGEYAFGVARFNSDGTPDNSFGTNGSGLTIFPGGDSTDDEARAVAVQSNGKIVSAGYSFGNSLFYPLYTGYAFALARYLPQGPTAVRNNAGLPRKYELYQNYPNPFNPTTTISYELSANSFITLKVYDILGREVATLVNGKENAGSYSVQFDGSKLASGVYFYRLTAGSFVSVKKLVVLK